MINKRIVYEALNRILASESGKKFANFDQSVGQDRLISLLIHDIFGGEILKTHSKKKWHYYNRIEGERVDFATRNEPAFTVSDNKFEDIPSSPDEPYDYVDQTDYSSFLMKFVHTFEEAVGLDKYRQGLTA